MGPVVWLEEPTMSSSDQSSTATVRITLPGRSRDAASQHDIRDPLPPARGALNDAALGDTDQERPWATSRALLDTIYDGLLVCGKGGRIVDVNERAAALFQRTAYELLQATIPDIIDGADEHLIAELESMAGIQPFAILDAYGMRADGSEFAAEIAVHPMEMDDGPRLVFFVRDISRRIQMERKLVRLSKAVASTSDGIAIADEEGRHIYQNASFLQLIGPQRAAALADARGFGWLLGAAAESMRRTVDAGHSWSGRTDLAAERGGLVPTLFRVDPIWQEDGRIIGSVAVVTDITKEQQAETKLRQTLTELERTNAELEQIAYVASHDLKEPLRVIIGYLDLLHRRYAGQLDDAARSFIQNAVDGADRMRNLINHILDYARLNRSPGPLTSVNAALLVRQAQDNLRSLIDERHAVITLDPLPDIRTAPTRMVQVFQNLIDNAVRYCDRDTPRVHVRAVRRELNWVFFVTDNGIGIDPELQARVFILFQRLHTREEYEGSGIGLATCKKIVERFGGTLWIEDSKPGQGSTFAFSVPLAASPSDLAHRDPSSLP
jgi:PAS domain S-box-containing protein